MAIKKAKFRKLKGIVDYTDYLPLSASNSASLSYTGGKFRVTTTNFDAFTGVKITSTRQRISLNQIKNKISGSMLVEQHASASRVGLIRLYQDMKAKLPGSL